MSDLIVNDEVLADSEHRLTRLHAEFQHLDDQKKELYGLWGSGDIADAMNDFFDNWSYKRKKLLSSIEDVGGMVTDTRKAFRDTDDKLAKAEHHGGGQGGR